MDPTTTMTGGQAIQGGLADIFVLIFQLGLNVFVVLFQAILTGVFSGFFSLFKTP